MLKKQERARKKNSINRYTELLRQEEAAFMNGGMMGARAPKRVVARTIGRRSRA